MVDVLLWVVLIGGGVLLLLVVGVAVLRSSHGEGANYPPMPVVYRAADSATWRTGTLRCTDDRMVLKGPGGLAAGPFVRGKLDLGVASPLSAADQEQLGRGELIQVPVIYGSSRFDLALDESRYTALRAWVEAVPPGWNSQVA